LNHIPGGRRKNILVQDIRSPERPDFGINVKDENYKSIFCHAEFYTLINRANAWGTIERDRRGRP
jgi:hypothetical protein